MLLDNHIPACFNRNIGSISRSQQIRLTAATVAVVGCGGLGGFVAEELARLGIGCLKICDPDRFSSSNINRQLYCSSDTLGKLKAVEASRHISALHAHTEVVALTTRFQECAALLLSDSDLAVDCLDNIKSRMALADECRKQGIPLVHGSVDTWYGQVGVQLPGHDLYRILYGKRAPEENSPSVLSCTVALVASLQVAEACKLLLGMDSLLHNNWLSIDLKRTTFEPIET